MANYLENYFAFFKINNVLLVSDINFFLANETIEVEAISDEHLTCQRFLSVVDFMNNNKKPLYYKYHFIVVTEKYLSLLQKLKYYFEDKHFTLSIILNANYLIEHDERIIELLENTKFQSKIIENDDIIVVELSR